MAALFLLSHSLLVALGAIFGPAALVEEADASRVGLYAQDYEGALCGLVAGPNGRDLTSRPCALLASLFVHKSFVPPVVLPEE